MGDMLSGAFFPTVSEVEKGAASQNKKITYPEQDVESKNEVFDAAADFLPFIKIPRHV